MNRLRYIGVDRRGNNRTGETTDWTPFDLGASLWANGWKWATIQDDSGRVVAAVGERPEGKGRIYWGEQQGIRLMPGDGDKPTKPLDDEPRPDVPSKPIPKPPKPKGK